MTVTDADIDLVRDWVGDEPDDDAIRVYLARDDVGEDPKRAARVILRRRLANVPSITSLGVSGDVSVSFTSAGIKDLLRQLNIEIGDGATDAGSLPAMTSTPIAPSREVAR